MDHQLLARTTTVARASRGLRAGRSPGGHGQACAVMKQY